MSHIWVYTTMQSSVHTLWAGSRRALVRVAGLVLALQPSRLCLPSIRIQAMVALQLPLVLVLMRF
ncbi:hypothetical protein D3C87_962550 [compost metagenome]